MDFGKILNYLPSLQLFQKRRKVLFEKKMFLKGNCSADLTADFDNDGDVILLKCKICKKYTAQIRTEAWSC